MNASQPVRTAPEALPTLDADAGHGREVLLGGRHWRRCLHGIARPIPGPTGPSQPSGDQCTSFELGPIVVAKSTVSSCELLRDRQVMAQDRKGRRLIMLLMLRGSLRGTAGDLAMDLSRGDIGILDLEREARFMASKCSVLSLLVPRNLIQGHAHGLALRESQLPCRMLTQHLQRLVLSLPATDPTRIAALAQAAVAVLQLCIDFTPATDPGDSIEELRCTILAHIDENLDDPTLTPDLLASRFHVSRTWLYRAFSGYGGIKRCIRDKRLDAAFRDLRDNPRQRVIDVAYRCGFSSERQFQRAFLARFQLTPSSVKDRRKTGLEIPEQLRLA